MKTKVLMVCLGNICRSPLAEGLLKSKLDAKKYLVESAGTGDWHIGQQPDPRSIAVAKKNSLDITQQRGRQFKASDFKEFDHIFVMDISNKNDVLDMASSEEEKKKVHLILDELFPNENVDVPDPYQGSERGFDNVYEMLDKATDVISRRI